MITSLITDNLERIVFDFDDPRLSTSDKINALEYYSLEQALSSLGMICIDKDVLEFLGETKFKSDLEKEIEINGKAFIDLSKQNISLENKSTVAQAYIHQEVKKALKNIGKFDLYIDNWKEYLYSYYFTKSLSFQKLISFIRMPENYEYFEHFVKILKLDGFDNIKKAMIEDLKSGKHPKDIIHDSRFEKRIKKLYWYENMDLIEKEVEKKNMLRRIFNCSPVVKDFGILKTTYEAYEKLDVDTKKLVNRIIIKNLADLYKIQFAQSLSPFSTEGIDFFDDYLLDAYKVVNNLQSKTQALIPLKGIKELLPLLKYELELIGFKIESFKREYSNATSISESNFFEIFPFDANETKELVFLIYQKILPTRVKVRPFDHPWVDPTEYFLMLDGKIRTHFEDTYAKKLLEGDNRPEEEKQLDKIIEVSIKKMLGIENDESIDSCQKALDNFVLEKAKEHGYFHVHENILPTRKGAYAPEDVHAVVEMVTEIREELDKQKIIVKLLNIGLGDKRWITVEKDAVNKFNILGREFEGISAPFSYRQDEDFIANGMNFVGKKADYYCKVLGVSENATIEEIKKAYRKIALADHDDRMPKDLIVARGRFIEATKAYNALINHRKAGYKGAATNPFIGRIEKNIPRR